MQAPGLWLNEGWRPQTDIIPEEGVMGGRQENRGPPQGRPLSRPQPHPSPARLPTEQSEGPSDSFCSHKELKKKTTLGLPWWSGG